MKPKQKIDRRHRDKGAKEAWGIDVYKEIPKSVFASVLYEALVSTPSFYSPIDTFKNYLDDLVIDKVITVSQHRISKKILDKPRGFNTMGKIDEDR